MISLVCVSEGLFTKVHGEIVERRVQTGHFDLLNMLKIIAILDNNVGNKRLKLMIKDHSQRFKTIV